VQQQEWDEPARDDWVTTLDQVIQSAEGSVTLIAHSLGCALIAWWAAANSQAPHAAKVTGALLVAPPDVEHDGFPATVTGFAPMPRIALPFPAIVAASSDDPWCALPKAQSWAADWRAEFHTVGARGHINGESGLGQWARGRNLLAQLKATE
jgi:predicted alpha/beta hydrolase family esterase